VIPPARRSSGASASCCTARPGHREAPSQVTDDRCARTGGRQNPPGVHSPSPTAIAPAKAQYVSRHCAFLKCPRMRSKRKMLVLEIAFMPGD